MRELDIGEVVRRSGVPASTLRYYEQLGLVQVLGRRGLRPVHTPRMRGAAPRSADCCVRSSAWRVHEQ